MPAVSTRVLVVEDYPAFRHYLVSTIRSRAELQIICEVADGSAAVLKAQELQPDLILLDIGLPGLNGIEAARRIRNLSPNSKILFVSENRSSDVIEEALCTGALGYVVKSDAARDLFPAIEAVLHGKEFVSASVSVQPRNSVDENATDRVSENKVLAVPLQNAETVGHHEAVFYSDDRQLLDRLSAFIAEALKNGNAAIVVATGSHRDTLVGRLQDYGLDVDAAIEQGKYIALDAADALSTFMLHDMPDPGRFLTVLGNLISTATKAVKDKQARVAIFGEMCFLLWAQGNAEAAIKVEKLGNQLTKTYDVDILCGYSVRNVQGGRMDAEVFQRICAEHSFVNGS